MGGGSLKTINVSDIRAGQCQPRTSFSDEGIAELAASIRSYGLLSPPLVRRVAGGYELIAGERRLRALRLLGEARVNAIVMPAPDEDAALMSLIENLQREALHYLDEAASYRRVVDEFGITQEELARRLGRSAPSVANKLRLLRLPEAIRARLLASDLSERHARALLRLPDERTQAYALEQALKGKLSVSKLEALVGALLSNGVPREKPVVCAYRDHRIFVNAVLDAVRAIKDAGVGVTSRVIERERDVEITVTVPRPSADALSRPSRRA